MQQHCSSCQSAVATVQILDLENSAIVKSKFLCDACASNNPQTSSGAAQLKSSHMQLSAEILENLLGHKPEEPNEPGSAAAVRCPACDMSSAEFRLRGRLGCPRCYEVFRTPLLNVLDRVHDATCHRGRFPGVSTQPTHPEEAPQAVPAEDSPAEPTNEAERSTQHLLIELEQRLQIAIHEERYEDAAGIRDVMDRVRRSGEAKE